MRIKKLVSMILALAMIFSLMGISAQATGTAPFTVTQERDTTTGNVTLTVKTSESFTFSAVNFTATWPSEYTLSSIDKGESVKTSNGMALTQKSTTTGGSIIESTDPNENGALTNATVSANTVLVTYTFAPTNTTAGSTYSFSITAVEGAYYADGGTSTNYTWSNVAYTEQVTIPVGEHTHHYVQDAAAGEWTWTGTAENALTATIKLACQETGCDYVLEKSADSIQVTAATTGGPTCTQAGVGTATASVTVGSITYTNTKSGTVTMAATGKHDMTKTDENPATCYQTGKKAYWTCSVCNYVFADAEGTQQLSGSDDASLTIPATGNHVYSTDGNCTTEGCTAEAPDFSAYYKIYDASGAEVTADVDGVNGLDVTANTTYTAKVYLKSGTDRQDITNFILNLTYSSASMTVEEVTGTGKYDTIDTSTAGKIKYQMYAPGENDTENTKKMLTLDTTGVLVAEFKFTVKSDVANGTSMTLGFDTSTVGQSPNIITRLDVTTADQDLGTLSKITVTWNLNGGNVDGKTDALTTTITRNTVPTVPDATIVRGGYTLTGWQLSTATGDSDTVYGTATGQTAFTKLTENTAYTAKWTANEYTVTYNLDGGSLEGLTDNAKTYTITSGDLGIPTKTGYTFEGWIITDVADSDTNLQTTNQANKDLTLTGHYGDVTVKAMWSFSIVAHTVEYNYAPTNGSLLIVSAKPDSGDTMTYSGTVMYYVAGTTDDNVYYKKLVNDGSMPVSGATGVYVTVLDAAYDASKIATAEGRDVAFPTEDLYDLDRDGTVDAVDASVAYQLLKNRDTYSLNHVGVLARLLADANHDFNATLNDATKIADNFTRTANSAN